ncbi:MAG: hypothetical protein M0R06_01575 [Sphaerochaeta sp.]|nr:hypothetical protein [Sphaerochaeta sp.]
MNVPIFIISFNRCTVLKTLVDRLIELEQDRLVVIDNASTYEPLIDYYRKEAGRSFTLMKMPRNYGHNVVGRLYKDPDFFKKYELGKTNYIYTDCDVVPVNECPVDFVDTFDRILSKYHRAEKVGFSLKITDLPDTFEAKERLIRWESKFWLDGLFDEELRVQLYRAPLDTTFSYQRKNTPPGWSDKSIRTGPPFMARHLPWYIDTNNLTEEDLYYTRVAMDKETHFPGRYVRGKRDDGTLTLEY